VQDAKPGSEKNSVTSPTTKNICGTRSELGEIAIPIIRAATGRRTRNMQTKTASNNAQNQTPGMMN
jgi:hypothetical protein